MSNAPESPDSGDDFLSQMMGQIDTFRRNTLCPQAISKKFSKVHQSETALILRCANRGMKVLVNIDGSHDKILSILEHERRVSDYLPTSCAHRKVHGLDTHGGSFGFNFDWVEGITLGKWLEQQNAQTNQEVDLKEHIHVAISIVKAVASFHEAGVAHNNITPDNIILSFESRQCSATLIDLARAVVLKDEHVASAERLTIDDMKALGCVLYSVFEGENASLEAASDSKEKILENARADKSRAKRGRNDKQQVNKNIPLYLISLLSALVSPSLNVGGTFKYQYQNANDVLNDLHAAVKKPELYLTPHISSDKANMYVQIPRDSFYGRLSEVSMVKQALDVVKKSGGQPIIISVSGFAGAG